MGESLESFFPFGVASKQSFIARSFHTRFSKTNYITVFWRFFLIIFPQTSKLSLSKQEWTSILQQQRNIYESLISLKDRINQNTEVHNRILASLTTSFMKISGKLTKEISDSLEKVLFYFIQQETPTKFLDIVSLILARIFKIFRAEAQENDDSPFGILMDKKYLYHDLFLSLKSIIQIIAPYISSGLALQAHLMQQITYQFCCYSHESKEYLLKRIPEIENQINEITNMYTKLFYVDDSQNETINDLFTVLFSECPQSSIFTTFFLYLFLNNVNDISMINTKEWIEAVGTKLSIINKFSYQQKLVIIGKKIVQLKKLIVTKDSPKIREVVKFQLQMIEKVLHNQLNWEEVVPLDALLQCYANL